MPAAGELWRLECGCVVRLDGRWMGDWEVTETLRCGDCYFGPGRYVSDGFMAAATLWDDGVGLPQARIEDDSDSYTTEYVTKPAPPKPEPVPALPDRGGIAGRQERHERAYGVCYQCPEDAAWYTRSRVPLCQTCARLLQEETTGWTT